MLAPPHRGRPDLSRTRACRARARGARSAAARGGGAVTLIPTQHTASACRVSARALAPCTAPEACSTPHSVYRSSSRRGCCDARAMSFADVHRSREAGGGGGAGGSGGGAVDEDAFAGCARSVASSIFQLTTNVTSFKRLVDALVRLPSGRQPRVPAGVGNPPHLGAHTSPAPRGRRRTRASCERACIVRGTRWGRLRRTPQRR